MDAKSLGDKAAQTESQTDRQTQIDTRHTGQAAPLRPLEIHSVSILWEWLF